MKKYMMTMITLMLGSLQLQAQETAYNLSTRAVNGEASYGKETIDQIVASGKIELNGTTVTTRLQVNGKLDAKKAHIKTMEIHGKTSLEHCSIGSMEVHGKTEMKDCSVSKKSVITGALEASSSKFLEELTVASDRIVFSSCTLNSLQVVEAKGFKKPQVVELKDNTVVNGSITFDLGNGEVIVGANCKIMGNIVGGKLRK